VSSRVAKVIDGKAVAAASRARTAARVAELKARHAVVPGLAVVLVGDDPASKVYVANKGREALAVGMQSFTHRLPAETSGGQLLELIAKLNVDEAVDGILVQLPLPARVNPERLIAAIDPAKDVDGLNPINAGLLMAGAPGLVPCTPLGCMELIRSVRDDITGLEAVVVGRSILVGKPVAHLLLQANATVTIAHSRTRDLPSVCRRADILVAAVGQPLLLGADCVKQGAIVIDVGINRVAQPGASEGKTRLVGDVDYAQAVKLAGAITPVPGGVGPMTIACLLANTLSAARRRRCIEA